MIEDLRKELLASEYLVTQKSQRRVERIAILHVVVFMLLAFAAFWNSPTTASMRTFSEDLGIEIHTRQLAILALIGAVLPPLLLTRWAKEKLSISWKQRFYMLSPMPILLYTIPLGWYAIRTGMSAIGAVVYIAIYFSFVVIACATYRE